MKFPLYSNQSKSYTALSKTHKNRTFLSKFFIFSISYIVSTICCANLPKVPSAVFSQRPEVKQFMQTMIKEHHFKAEELQRWFSAYKTNPEIIAKMTTPYETKPWYLYRSAFVKPKIIQDGVLFWHTHHKTLHSIEKKYGVPTSIMLAILGVETHYGKFTGSFPTLQALATLAFDYPPRSKYFKKELVEYLLLCRKEKFDPITVRGSYAGALGIPQFMPSSYRQYAVGLHGPLADIIHNPDHAIASIGHYLSMKGWEKHHPIATKAKLSTAKLLHSKQLNSTELKAKYSLKALAQYGIQPETNHVSPTTLANIITLETKNKLEYWIGFHNFYVITRYNTSTLYAMAVYQLSDAIEAAYLKDQKKQKNTQRLTKLKSNNIARTMASQADKSKTILKTKVNHIAA